MYKVLIVDDEVLVRVGLKTTIDWEAIGFSIVAEASNGEQGFEQYKKHLPEVIITDIKMPKQDGLWLVEKVRKENSQVKILVLTCYDEFSYARKALKVGADDYILKSEVEDEELIALMISIRNKIDAQNKTKLIHEHVLNNTDDIKKSIFLEICKSDFDLGSKLIERLNGINFRTKETKVAFISISMIHGEQKVQSETTQSNQALLNIIFGQFTEEAIDYVYSYEMNRSMFFLSSPTLNTTVIKRIITAASNSAKQYFDIYLNSVSSVVIGEMGELPMVYKAFINKAEILFYKKENTFTFMGIDAITFIEPNVFDLKKKHNKGIVEAIGQEDIEKTNDLVREVGSFFNQNNINPMIVKIFFSNLMGDIFSSYGLFLENSEEFKTHEYYHYKIESSKQLDNIVQLLMEFTSKVINAIQNMRHNNSKQMINKALNFIEYHYEEKISLDDVAKELNLSKHYLCSAFKKETGTNMSLYINKLRIEKAKQMLLESDVKIKEIFEKVGYANQQYFSKVFKKVTGQTVIEYKECIVKTKK